MTATILIVDDDPLQRRLVEAMVRRFGYETSTAEGGDAAIKILLGADQPRIDCVVLDLVMPDLDGLGVLARMRAAALRIPVIAQTAHGGIDNVASAMRAGAIDFVVKPVGAERLQVSLRNALASRALEAELERFKEIIAAAPASPAQAIQVSAFPLEIVPSAAPQTAPTAPVGAMSALALLDAAGHMRPLEELESEVIRFALTHYCGQMSKVARRLQIGRSTLYRKLKDFGLEQLEGAEMQRESVAAK